MVLMVRTRDMGQTPGIGGFVGVEKAWDLGGI